MVGQEEPRRGQAPRPAEVAPRLTVADNRAQGAAFESLFESQARLQGFLVLKTPVSAQYTFKGRLQAIKGPLDWEVVDQSGRTGHFDTKAFSRDRFARSDIEEHQIERAALYNDWGVPAGFVVYWARFNRVGFYPGKSLLKPGRSFAVCDGVHLGSLGDFDLSIAMRRPRSSRFRLDPH